MLENSKIAPDNIKLCRIRSILNEKFDILIPIRLEEFGTFRIRTEFPGGGWKDFRGDVVTINELIDDLKKIKKLLEKSKNGEQS